MEKKVQYYTKLTDCEDNCPRCPVFNLVQRKIAKNLITDETEMLEKALWLQDAKCPEGRHMAANLLYPANTNRYKNEKRHNLWW